MGYGYCRFGCGYKTNEDYLVQMKEPDIILLVCGMWRHYAEYHKVQPRKEIRELVMGKDVDISKLPRRETGDMNAIPILFVEKRKGLFKKDTYTHKIGESADTEFIEKLQNLIDKFGQKILYME